MLATLFRCMEKASLPLYASMAAALVNTGLNYVLIFGKFGFPAMGAKGVAVATVVAQLINFFIMFVLYFQCKKPFTEKDRNASKVAGFPCWYANLCGVLEKTFMRQSTDIWERMPVLP